MIFTFSYYFFCISGTHNIHGVRWLLFICLLCKCSFPQKNLITNWIFLQLFYTWNVEILISLLYSLSGCGWWWVVFAEKDVYLCFHLGHCQRFPSSHATNRIWMCTVFNSHDNYTMPPVNRPLNIYCLV